MKKLLYVIGLCVLLIACKDQKKNSDTAAKLKTGDTLTIKYAKGFSIVDYGDFKLLEVKQPFPKSTETFTYLLAEKGATIPKGIDYNQKIQIPVHKVIVTSTTHIPSLVILDEANTLVGFPHLDFISSPKIRKRIDAGKVAELGENTHLNTEIVLSLQPDVLIGFSMKTNNKTYNIISKSGIPVVYNGDWNEQTPLGKAEWIKFFGAFYNKLDQASKLFNSVEGSYLAAKRLAKKAETSPTVLAGAMFKDVWYLPAGDSWAAKFFADANADYLYKNSPGTGSLSLSVESVLNKAQQADFWISPGGFTSYQEMSNHSPHYKKFEAFQQKSICTYGRTKGETGGVLYFELGPNRPDLVLKDLIHIFHPELLPNYENTFYKPLK